MFECLVVPLNAPYTQCDANHYHFCFLLYWSVGLRLDLAPCHDFLFAGVLISLWNSSHLSGVI